MDCNVLWLLLEYCHSLPMKRVFNPANKRTILMVHDDDLVAQASREQLQSAGFKVEAAEDGARAMQLLENNAIALVLLDLGLARDSGIEVLERIRGQFARLPVVVFFNPFLLNLERTAMKAGACKSVVKTKVPPPELPLLIQTLPSPAPKILAVDDEAIARETVCAALTKAELPCEGLSDSPAAQYRLEAESFDLIFLDVEMPAQSGLELCVKIREMQTNTVTPVVFVTSHSDFGSRAQSTLSGGNDFIAKPFQATELAIKALTHLFTRNLRPLPKDQRSTSPMTISTLPRMTMTSATV
jgi:DNA-binding response OmpR family regulator